MDGVRTVSTWRDGVPPVPSIVLAVLRVMGGQRTQVADVEKDPMAWAPGLLVPEMRDTRILFTTTLTTATAFNTPTGWTISVFL